MQTGQLIYDGSNWIPAGDNSISDPDLILFFVGKALVNLPLYEQLKEAYPHAHIAGCSTAGEILGEEVFDDSAVASTIKFETSHVECGCVDIQNADQSFDKGVELGGNIPHDGLKGVLLISDGHKVNGSAMIDGVKNALPDQMIITGGLAGIGPDFTETYVSCNSPLTAGKISIIGFYGDRIKIGHGSIGGWDSFGPIRKITKATGNVLYELDQKPALELYKKYLGDEADNLPASALLFPLNISPKSDLKNSTVRTILNVDEGQNSMTFAGDMPVGHNAQLMMANFDKLIDGASSAASHAISNLIADDSNQKLAILISCIGRKLVLGAKTVEEVEATQAIFGKKTQQVGFYSYGEISPHVETGSCELHNQTMTVTLISE